MTDSAATTLPVRYQELGHGIRCIDTQLQRGGLASCYLLVEKDQAAFIDCGTGNSVPVLLEVLRRAGLQPEQVSYVIPTHVHLDHAGGAGRLMQHCVNASLVVHPRGARHMINPEKLQQGALAVYGEAAFGRLFGSLEPIAEQRVIEATDGFELDLGGRVLQFLDTPGHARHHVCVHDARSSGIFTGDTFGASYPELNNGRARFIFPPTTPIQFDPDAWLASIERLLALQPERVYLTHFGMHDEPEALGRQLRERILDYAEIARELMAADNREEKIGQALMQSSINYLLDQQCGLDDQVIRELLAMDMQLNAQGLDYWLQTSPA